MQSFEENIKEKINELLPEEKKEVYDFIEFLKHKRINIESITPKKNFSFTWAGGLEHLKNKFTSVDLQHKASEWMIE